MDLEDIEDFYHPSIRIYQGDKYLVRSSINQPRYIQRSIPLQIFDENENELTIDDIDNTKQIICILEVLGIKFTTTSIRTEICLRQIMTLDNSPVFTKCLIHLPKEKKNKLTNVTKNSLVVDSTMIQNEKLQQKSVSFTVDKSETEQHDSDDEQEEKDKNIEKVAAKATDFIMTDRKNNTVEDLAKTDISGEQQDNTNKIDDIDADIKKEIHDDVKNDIHKKTNNSLIPEKLDRNLEKKERKKGCSYSRTFRENCITRSKIIYFAR